MAKKNATFGKMRIDPDANLAMIVGAKSIGPTEITKLTWDYIRKNELLFIGGRKARYDPVKIRKARAERKAAEKRRRAEKEAKKAAAAETEKETSAELAMLRRKAGILERIRKQYKVK